jgi:D-alanyl-lipoteichoic acid acyltransferase DltB (MBOAT superfamily)
VWMRFYGKWKKDANMPQFLASVTIGTSGLHIPRIAGFRDVISILITFQFVCFGWILFYCPSLTIALHAFIKMFGGG